MPTLALALLADSGSALTWTAATDVRVGELRVDSGLLYRRITAGTTGSTFAGEASSWEAMGAATTAVTSVAGRTGAVVITATDVNLSNVTNTSDPNKPVSTAQATALAGKQRVIPKYATVAAAQAGLTAGEFADGDLVIVTG